MQILVVEDEVRMASLLRAGLTEEGHHVIVSGDGEEAFEIALLERFDVIVLDVMLPKLDGFAVARRLRKCNNQTPLLMLTARDADSDVIRALNSGADDYVTKPFSFEVLLAGVRAVGRRGQIPQPINLQAADLTLDTSSRRVTRAGRSITLTPREFSLLELLLRHKGRVVTRERILESVWGFNSRVEENTLEVFIRLLRNKVDVPGNPKLIHTVRGIGYSLREPQ